MRRSSIKYTAHKNKKFKGEVFLIEIEGGHITKENHTSHIYIYRNIHRKTHLDLMIGMISIKEGGG